MNFRDEYKDGTEVSLVKRNRIFKDKIVLTGVVVPPVDGFVDDRFIWCKVDNSIYYASSVDGAILGFPREYVTVAGDEELRDNILCRIIDFFLIKMGQMLEFDDSDKGSCV